MSALHQLAEALARVEHKLDLLLSKASGRDPGLTPVGDPNHYCPICKNQVKYIVDPIIQVLLRKCGCKTGLQAPFNLEAYAPPKKRNANGQDDDTSGNDSSSDRRPPGIKSPGSR